ncbi:hypothetical protein PISL3812_05872 [Talaromyces islandicus]|uniref:RNA-dependent RNA polymerase n=1 Tax=Talaromyces islandicus TaxID=28573 RepID=A0A0U1LZV8_TALIS|nr:hypothetical protein PISL3812_05872 [Talaromyces islandicus]
MEVFCRKVPTHLKKHHLKRELTPILAGFDILAFECRVHARGGLATITIPDIDKAMLFLERYQQKKGQQKPPHQQLRILGTIIFVEEGKYEPDSYLLSALQNEETQRRSRPRRPIPISGGSAVHVPKKFPICSVSCGHFDFSETNPVFVEHWRLQVGGHVKFGPTKLIVTMPSMYSNLKLDFSYSSLRDCIYMSDSRVPAMTFYSYVSPHMYDVPFEPLPPHPRAAHSAAIARPAEKKRRVCFLDASHKIVVSSCFVYRVLLENPSDLRLISSLSSNRNIPSFERWKDTAIHPDVSYANQLRMFLVALSQQTFSFAVRFQLQMLVWNGELPINKVIKIFPYVEDLLSRHQDEYVAKMIRELPRRLSPPTPHAEIADVRLERIVKTLHEIEDSDRYFRPGYLHQNQVGIHRASVTPTGIYLDGPNAEKQNRVLRKYSAYSDSFLRVRFIEETGDMMTYDPSSNLDSIFHGRFREVLRDGIIIAGRHYVFLGFSHSSLRSRTCWFMAPFEDRGEIITVEKLIPKLGDFNHIRSPAKFAARLGQTFSDTLTSIPIEPHAVKRLPDVERNGRVFSDGCGTISQEILRRIYRDYPRQAGVRPTVFQIRFSGAKGMLSLDSSLEGQKVFLRNSMIKFEAGQDSDIEICGSGIERLPCYLNAPLIRILEDLGVARDVFLELQREEVDSLLRVVQSPQQVMRFLEESHISKSTRLPWLVSVLRALKLRYVQDPFLKRTIELALIMRLRDLKYKARIRIPKAVTLYGIMDETGFLNEGEIFVPMVNERFRREILVCKNVIITRSPAFHPGDVQLANAVSVPKDSPLRELHNCVVFSQKGSRDLPSQLSGGDLDGDLFNLIYDDRIRLHRIATPADYPRVPGVVLDRPVTIKDIQDFFITFMKQDQLGRIATTHKILADCRPGGTFNAECLTLAQLHSTAVDFSKTGTPVDVTKIPRSPPYRPDFMAPGPRVRVAESIEVLEDEDRHTLDDEEDDEDARPSLNYYKSKCALGHLYGMINEKEFLQDLRNAPEARQPPVNVLQRLWKYIEQETAGFIWDHNKEDAYSVRDIYEDGLLDIMYCYSDSPWKTTLTEEEVFIGNIMGRNHKQTIHQKESSRAMREAYDELVSWTMSLITGQGTDKGGESLERSIACFWAALNDRKGSFVPPQGKLRSFPWIAAIVCIQEVDKLASI